ncbi:YdbH domain-containing protein [Shewanella sp. TC10]|uniref:YdbH domain-containing protein n=1 Tax=Shewanella sp. TC10 TaxID=1419739 RepID=UPI001892C2A0|nr:YdbH domain-containing protein [Shewanella sp. TC10]
MLQQNFRPLALKFINSLTEPYHVEVIDVEVKLTDLTQFKLTDLNQLSLPWLKMRYQDSVIELKEIQLDLFDGYSAIKSMSLSIEDIKALHVADIQVSLGESFLQRQEQGENSDNLGLSINQIPQIALDNISVYLPTRLQDKVPFPIIQTQYLQLADIPTDEKLNSKNTGQKAAKILSATLNLMEQQVLKFDLTLDKERWQLNHQTDIDTLLVGVAKFNGALGSTFDQVSSQINKQSNVSKSAKPEFMTALDRFVQHLEESQIEVNGKWNSQTTLDLVRGSIASQHKIIPVAAPQSADIAFSANTTNTSWKPIISSPLLSSIAFTPESTIEFAIDYSPVTDNSPAKVALALQPIIWRLKTHHQQLDEIITLFNLSDLTVLDKQATILAAELSQPIDWTLSLDKPLTIEMPINNQSMVNVFNTDLSLNVSHPTLSAMLNINEFSIDNLSTDLISKGLGSVEPDSLQINSALSLNIKQKQKVDLQAYQNKEKSVANSIVINDSEVNISATLSADAQSAKIALLPQSEIHTEQLTLQLPHKSLSFDNLYWQLTKPASIQTSYGFSTSEVNGLSGSQSQSNIDQSAKLILADFMLGFDSFSFINHQDSSLLTESFEIFLGAFELKAQQDIELSVNLDTNNQAVSSDINAIANNTTAINATGIQSSLKQSNQSNPGLVSELLAQTNETELDWSLQNIRIDKLIPNRSKVRRYKVLRLDEITLNQQLRLQQQLLTGRELWQLDELLLSSYHLLRLPQQQTPVSLAGQWQVDTDLQSVINTLGQTQMLPDNLTLSGYNKLNAGFALNESQGVSLFEMKFEQQLTQLDAKYNDNFFYDANLTSNCQFNWQQVHSTPSQPTTYSQSRLLCQQAELNIADAYVGVNLENINLKANISLGKNDEIPAKNWLQEISGLSDTDVNLTACGDLLDGQFLIPEFYVKLHDKSEGYFVLNGISLESLLAAQPQVGVYADGIFDGVLPATLIDGKVTIKGGHLAARQPGGLIQVSNNPALEQIRNTQPYLDFVVQALEHLEYSQLSSSFDMEDNGDASLKIQVKGKSQDIERPIHLNYSHEENLFQLYKSTQIGNRLQNDIERSVK